MVHIPLVLLFYKGFSSVVIFIECVGKINNIHKIWQSQRVQHGMSSLRDIKGFPLISET